MIENYSSAYDVVFDSDAGNGLTVREYLKKLLLTVWVEEEGFSGKRPFGNSGWKYELYKPLVKSGHLEGSFDEDGYLEDLDDNAHEFVITLINNL